jgi:hypothetical protein
MHLFFLSLLLHAIVLTFFHLTTMMIFGEDYDYENARYAVISELPLLHLPLLHILSQHSVQKNAFPIYK